MKIDTVSGEQVLVSDEDFGVINGSSLHLDNKGYVKIHHGRNWSKLHRVLTNCPDNLEVDHINGDKLDNRRENLRICTRSENARNKGLTKNNKSGVAGVSWDEARNKWMASIKLNKKSYNLGRFDKIEDAIRIRKDSEQKMFGVYRREVVGDALATKNDGTLTH